MITLGLIGARTQLDRPTPKDWDTLGPAPSPCQSKSWARDGLTQKIKITSAAKFNNEQVSDLNQQLPSSNPKEDESVILQNGDVQFSHLVVSQCSVGQLHVDVPRWVGHHHGELPQDGHVQVSDVAADPLQGKNIRHHLRHLGFWPGSLLHAHLRGEEFPHVAVAVSRPQSQLRGPGLGPQQAALGLWGAVNLIVDIFAGVHMETSVEEGAVAETLVSVFVDDATACYTNAR